ncbi:MULTISPECIES: glycosyltransferase family 2 protein [Enterobacter]|nr:MULTISPECIES: glycosyltransferase family A protein [Enterobacter]ELC7251774.1 glycosyltransferase family 2 protein [Enterobacter hormaechei]EUM31233.1 hypothetical protein L435_06447 [Enterobacter hormaechei]MCE1213845.1 glycosyltransferase family 2 protein [Enterobacter hormaechei]MCW4763341.1 glycosyltransferase family 2 protein [Enterobacter hormaechei subsp. xiangfangensis]MDA4665876.1 glycosyltransferase family 2 protein [Enterobacter hormaechei]
MKVSIIVPVYNVEDYLRECLDSILNQTYSNFEVICINDGSTDSSLLILEEYQKKDSRLRCFSYENAGLSVARNRGLELIRGDLCYFMDSDDMITSNCLEKCVEIFKQESDIDAVFFNADAFANNGFQDKLINYNYIRNIPQGKYDSQKLFKQFIMKGKYVVSACCYMFKVNSYKKLRFYEGILHEDNLYTTNLLLMNDKKCYVLEEVLFNRRVRGDSITTVSKTINHVKGYIFTYSHLKKTIPAEHECYNKAFNKYLLSLLMSASVDLSFVSNISWYKILLYRFSILKWATPLLYWDFKVMNLMRLYTPFLWKLKSKG